MAGCTLHVPLAPFAAVIGVLLYHVIRDIWNDRDW